MRDDHIPAIRNSEAALAMAQALAAQVDRLTERVHELEQDRARRRNHTPEHQHGQEQEQR
jgi:hypothetical protein